MLILVNRAKVLLDLLSVFLILGCLLLSISFDLVEHFCLLELGLVLSAGATGLQLGLKLDILLVKFLLELLFDVLLGILELLEHGLEVAITAGILQFLLEL